MPQLGLSFFFFSSRRRHTRLVSDWSSDVCSSDLKTASGATPRPSSSRPCWQAFHTSCCCNIPLSPATRPSPLWTFPLGHRLRKPKQTTQAGTHSSSKMRELTSRHAGKPVKSRVLSFDYLQIGLFADRKSVV